MTAVSYRLDARGSTVTFSYGSYTESFDATYLGPYELYDRIRWAAFAGGLRLSEETLERLLREVQGLVPA